MNLKDTIAAIATPEGRGGVGIIRLSGPSATSILQKLTQNETLLQSHFLSLRKIYNSDGTLLDEGLVVWMQEPNSYTGQDVVEFQCHGSSISLRSVLDACLQAGARIADPGEFTQRAFLNGKLDLTQAEAVADLINATSERAHKMALSHLNGDLGKIILHCREKIAQAMMLVEAAIDFSHEEHVYQIERDEVLKRLQEVLKILVPLREGFDHGRRQREGISVAILGPPNAGKSTLFNALLGSDRAIVTEIAGTTRDYLSEALVYDGVSINLIDTAGLHETEDRVEAIGVARSREISQRADVVLWMEDASNLSLGFENKENKEKLEEIERYFEASERVAIILNKIDLAPEVNIDTKYPTLRISLASEKKAEEVKILLRGFAHELTAREGVLLSRARHLESVVAAIEAAELAAESVKQKQDNEIIALDLREALDALGRIVGEVSADDILNRIFSDFCVGK